MATIKRAILTHRRGSLNQFLNFNQLKLGEFALTTTSPFPDLENLVYIGNGTGKGVLVGKLNSGNSAPVLTNSPYVSILKDLLFYERGNNPLKRRFVRLDNNNEVLDLSGNVFLIDGGEFN